MVSLVFSVFTSVFFIFAIGKNLGIKSLFLVTPSCKFFCNCCTLCIAKPKWVECYVQHNKLVTQSVSHLRPPTHYMYSHSQALKKGIYLVKLNDIDDNNIIYMKYLSLKDKCSLCNLLNLNNRNNVINLYFYRE